MNRVILLLTLVVNFGEMPLSVAVGGSGDRVFVGLVGAIATHAASRLGVGAQTHLLMLPTGVEPLGLAADVVVR